MNWITRAGSSLLRTLTLSLRDASDLEGESSALLPALLVIGARFALARLRRPFLVAAVLAGLPSGLDSDSPRVSAVIESMGHTQLLGAILPSLVYPLALAVAIWAMVLLHDGAIRFDVALQIGYLTCVCRVLQEALELLILWLRGTATLGSPTDLFVPVGLGMALPDVALPIRQALDALNVFSIWQVAIVADALQTAASFPTGKAWFVAAAAWLLIEAIRVGGYLLLYQAI